MNEQYQDQLRVDGLSLRYPFNDTNAISQYKPARMEGQEHDQLCVDGFCQMNLFKDAKRNSSRLTFDRHRDNYQNQRFYNWFLSENLCYDTSTRIVS
ncbi:hypothetical protein DPMN_056820 [Dreissena polymorpha]|uniref:Uncharacterized protein n=1 Tax=Dreissena polymorpha TaxID=45954 RepID=A0A9D4CUE8_DREPO|nr:hypothetical protein DPMN_056820 [Dreissena polymorpha]